MATNTSKYLLKKPAYSDTADIGDINDNMDSIDSVLFDHAGSIAVICMGNVCGVSVTTGQYVLLQKSTISGKADGLYTAAKGISANTPIDGTYLTAVSGGIANALNGKIASLTYATTFNKTVTNGQTLQNIGTITMPNNKAGVVTLTQYWSSGKPDGCGLSTDASTFSEVGSYKNAPSVSSYYLGQGVSAYVWAKLTVNNGSLTVVVAVQYIG